MCVNVGLHGGPLKLYIPRGKILADPCKGAKTKRIPVALKQAGYAWCLENYGTLLFVHPSEFEATIAAMEAPEESQRM